MGFRYIFNFMFGIGRVPQQDLGPFRAVARRYKGVDSSQERDTGKIPVPLPLPCRRPAELVSCVLELLTPPIERIICSAGL